MRVIGAFAAILLGACSMLGTAGGRTVPADFAFVRDPDGRLAAAEVEGAETQLRQIAERSGVFGIVLVAGRLEDVPAPEAILDDVASLGGEAVIGFCTPDACNLQGADVASVAMGELLRQVAPAPEPAPGQGIPPGAVGLRAWIEFIGAVAVVADEAGEAGEAQP